MSAESPIFIVDDGEENVEQCSTKDSALVTAFLEVMPNKSRDYACKMLDRTNQNLEQALLLALDGEEQSRQEQPAKSSRQCEVSTGASTAAASDKTAKASKDSLTSLKSSQNDEEEAETATVLSDEWHRRYEMAQASDSDHVDTDFPPASCSLDGRRQKTSNETEVTCFCGDPAKARSVQRDGPNYGRFYLACGGQSSQKCGFFQWDKDGSRGVTRYSQLSWHAFGPPECVLVKGNVGPDQVKQGAVGNCWFLSALAVVAEQPYLIRQLMPHKQLNDVGIYQVNLCLDGKWTPIIIDSYLPIIKSKKAAPQKPAQQEFRGIVGDRDFVPAFCDVPKGQMWPALVEKAYAKAHGSYAQLSGGFIAEALADMTGAPTETLVFDGNQNHLEWRDMLWARLLSFQESGFLMGVATSRGGEGLVGGHAYSVLDVLEFQDVLVGEQQRVTDFFSGAKGSPAKKKQRKSPTTVRLVRIRNPWGKREWKGEWSVNSDKWTTALRKRLGNQSFAKGDGTFFMSLEDVMAHFHHMDVAKCRQVSLKSLRSCSGVCVAVLLFSQESNLPLRATQGWKHTSMDGTFQNATPEPLVSSLQLYRLAVSERTWAFISLIQPKKRANTKTQYWYGDLSMLILKRRRGPNNSWSCESSAIQGCSRSCTSEIFLDPSNEYVCLPFSYHGRTGGRSHGGPFRVTLYSSCEVSISAEKRDAVVSRIVLELLHRELLKMDHKVHYPIAKKGLLLCIHGRDCLYFVVLNAAEDSYLSLRLSLDVKKGMVLAYGRSGDTFDVSPRSQKIAMVALSDGTDSASVSVTFSYACDTIATDTPKQSASTWNGHCRLGSSMELTMAGDLIASEISSDAAVNKGGDTVETYLWLSQLGSFG